MLVTTKTRVCRGDSTFIEQNIYLDTFFSLSQQGRLYQWSYTGSSYTFLRFCCHGYGRGKGTNHRLPLALLWAKRCSLAAATAPSLLLRWSRLGWYEDDGSTEPFSHHGRMSGTCLASAGSFLPRSRWDIGFIPGTTGLSPPQSSCYWRFRQWARVLW